MNTIKFWLDGCDINLIAEAPEDITLKQLLAQCDRIKPDWCACGIHSCHIAHKAELKFTYDDVIKIDPYAPCIIEEAK